jgi:hypothetical protein
MPELNTFFINQKIVEVVVGFNCSSIAEIFSWVKFSLPILFIFEAIEEISHDVQIENIDNTRDVIFDTKYIRTQIHNRFQNILIKLFSVNDKAFLKFSSL